MKIICVDETGLPQQHLFGVSAVVIDSTKYARVHLELTRALHDIAWNPKYEFKGCHIFSARGGDPSVPVCKRIRAVDTLVAECCSSGHNSRVRATLAWNRDGESIENYLHLVGLALSLLGLKPGRKAGTDLVAVFCDALRTVPMVALRSAVREWLHNKQLLLLEDVFVADYDFDHAGLALADIIGYLSMWNIAHPDVPDFGGLFETHPDVRKNKQVGKWHEGLKSVKSREFPLPRKPLSLTSAP